MEGTGGQSSEVDDGAGAGGLERRVREQRRGIGGVASHLLDSRVRAARPVEQRNARRAHPVRLHSLFRQGGAQISRPRAQTGRRVRTGAP
ncbi:MAG: hypothetical protein QOF84_6937 [Streptomyces sp.]|nr:hypothetical protein [Streptomyces sp.]